MISSPEIVTESSLRASISVGLRHLAKAIQKKEILSSTDEAVLPLPLAYSQVGDWLKNHATTYDGRVINISWFRCLLAEELDNLRYLVGEQAYWAGNYPEAGRLFNELASQTIE